jgi:hypothetical protein
VFSIGKHGGQPCVVLSALTIFFEVSLFLTLYPYWVWKESREERQLYVLINKKE